MRKSQPLTLMLLVMSLSAASNADEPMFKPEQIEFFETKIRPLLAEHCYSCHSAKSKKLKAGLYVDSRAKLILGGESGAAIVPGEPDKSLLMEAVRYESVEMPPDGKLKDVEIAALAEWVKQGAPWPETNESSPTTQPKTEADWNKLRKSHWAWQPVTKPALPDVKTDSSIVNAIDLFVVAALQKQSLPNNTDADSRTLVRRMYLDMVGMIPSPERISAFQRACRDSSNRTAVIDALIEELLDSPEYGERWGRHWLDVARYSDGLGGFLDNAALPDAWRYRDWVIKALNDDMPYNDFIRLQIAGDLIGQKPEDGIATGFFAIGPTYRSDGGDPDSVAQAKGETLDDRVDTFSRGLLGITVSCARCHDHKFDPIPQLDYYSLAGIFNNTATQKYQIADEETRRKYNDQQAELNRLNNEIKKLNSQLKKEKRQANANEQKQLKGWNQELAEIRKTQLPAIPTAHALRDTGSRDMPLAIRGNLRKAGPVATRRFLRILTNSSPRRFSNGSGRIELAEAVVAPNNPLTARVFVNRVWMHHFGQPLVGSPSNFGTLGQTPTHPELLDWLAATFVESNWSIKELHRLILRSATYQKSSANNRIAFERDARNKFLWRMQPRRMDVESWRDSLLSTTGELDKSAGGPPNDNIVASNRRTVYARVSRNGDRFASDTFLRLFDFPLMRATISKRPVSIVPQQFLFMMNSEFMVKRAEALVKRLRSEASDDTNRIKRAYQLLYGRPPRPEELALGLEYLSPESAAASKPTPQTPPKPQPGADLLIADFEGTDYGKWKTTGTAFGNRPAPGTLPRQMVVTGFEGHRLVNSFYGGDAPQGTLTSPPIKLERKFIRFLIGGGGFAGTTCMNLKVDGKVVRTAVGPNTQGGGSEKLDWKHWDVTEFAGKSAVIEIVDKRSGGWGHINVDQILQSNQAQGSRPVKANSPKSPLDPWVQYAQVLLSSNEFMYIR